MPSTCPPAIVFTAIDSLPLAIDEGHRRLPALLGVLAAERIVPVFCSFRTRAQIEGFRQSVGILHPFVCENGGAAFVPRGYFGTSARARAVGGYDAIECALTYEHLVASVRRVASQYRLEICGYADMPVEQVARECGLSLLDARFAKLREYGEPFRLLRGNPAAERRLISALESAGICCTRHGAFLHAASVPGPERAAATLIALYRAKFGAILTAAAGKGIDGLMARVDLGIEDVTASAETVAWIEHVVERVRAARGAAAVA